MMRTQKRLCASLFYDSKSLYSENEKFSSVFMRFGKSLIERVQFVYSIVIICSF